MIGDLERLVSCSSLKIILIRVVSEQKVDCSAASFRQSNAVFVDPPMAESSTWHNASHLTRSHNDCSSVHPRNHPATTAWYHPLIHCYAKIFHVKIPMTQMVEELKCWSFKLPMENRSIIPSIQSHATSASKRRGWGDPWRGLARTTRYTFLQRCRTGLPAFYAQWQTAW